VIRKKGLTKENKADVRLVPKVTLKVGLAREELQTNVGRATIGQQVINCQAVTREKGRSDELEKGRLGGKERVREKNGETRRRQKRLRQNKER